MASSGVQKVQDQHSFERDQILITCENPFHLIKYSSGILSDHENKGEKNVEKGKLSFTIILSPGESNLGQIETWDRVPLVNWD